MSFLKTLANAGRIVAFYPNLARFLGSREAAIFMAQLAYWGDKAASPLGVYKTAEEWTEETSLSYKEQLSVRKMLKAKGFLEETHKRLQGMMFYRLNVERIDAAYQKWCNEIGCKTQEENQVVSKLNEPKNPKKREKTLINQPSSPREYAGVPREAVLHRVHTNRLQKESPKGDMRPSRPQSADTISETLEKVRTRVTRKREQKAAPASVVNPKLRITQDTVKAAWQQAMLKHYPTVPVLSIDRKGLAILRNCLPPLLASSSLCDVFEFFVEYWSTLRVTKFKWLAAKGKTVSEAPSLSELIRYWKIFAKAFADQQAIREEAAARKVVTDEERLMADNRALAAQLSKAQAALAETQRRLRIAQSTPSVPIIAKDTRTLTERRAMLPDLGDAAIPTWRNA